MIGVTTLNKFIGLLTVRLLLV